jgi:hypothetical protein
MLQIRVWWIVKTVFWFGQYLRIHSMSREGQQAGTGVSHHITTNTNCLLPQRTPGISQHQHHFSIENKLNQKGSWGIRHEVTRPPTHSPKQHLQMSHEATPQHKTISANISWIHSPNTVPNRTYRCLMNPFLNTQSRIARPLGPLEQRKVPWGFRSSIR